MEILDLLNSILKFFTPVNNLICSWIERRRQLKDALKKMILIIRLMPIESRKKDCDFELIREKLQTIPPILRTYYKVKMADVFESNFINTHFSIRYKAEINEEELNADLKKFIKACRKAHYLVH